MKNLVFLSFILIWLNSICFSQNSNVQHIINSINSDSLMNFIAELSGENQVNIFNQPYYIKTRYKGTEGNTQAAEYLKQKLQSYGYEVQINTYSQTGCNVYAIKQGSVYPDKKYFISAHYDDKSEEMLVNAPGADDNASGCSVVLEAARIFSKCTLKYSVAFAFWDEEEQGYVGAKNFILSGGADIEGIQGVIESDMIGWDGNNDKALLIQPSLHDGAIVLKDKILETQLLYNLDIKPIIYDIGWADPMINLFPVVGLNEDSAQSSPTYHTILDNLSTINENFLQNNAKLAIGALAHVAEIESINPVINEKTNSEGFFVSEIYPNPCDDLMKVKFSSNIPSNIIIKITNLYGKTLFSRNSEKIKINANNDFEYDVSELSSGTYFITLVSELQTITKQFLVIR